jgi:hypothetical protein
MRSTLLLRLPRAEFCILQSLLDSQFTFFFQSVSHSPNSWQNLWNTSQRILRRMVSRSGNSSTSLLLFSPPNSIPQSFRSLISTHCHLYLLGAAFHGRQSLGLVCGSLLDRDLVATHLDAFSRRQFRPATFLNIDMHEIPFLLRNSPRDGSGQFFSALLRFALRR